MKVVLVKILNEKYLDDFLDGRWCLNTLDYFSQLPVDDFVRSDQFEGANEIFRGRIYISDYMKDDWVEIKGFQYGVYRHSKENREFTHLMCMYAIKDDKDFKFDQRNLEFGDVAVFIKDADELFKRLALAINDSRLKQIMHGLVEYLDLSSFDGRISCFQKTDTLHYQNEYRFAFRFECDDSDKRKFINIGDIRDITLVTASAEIPNAIEYLREKL